MVSLNGKPPVGLIVLVASTLSTCVLGASHAERLVLDAGSSSDERLERSVSPAEQSAYEKALFAHFNESLRAKIDALSSQQRMALAKTAYRYALKKKNATKWKDLLSDDDSMSETEIKAAKDFIAKEFSADAENYDLRQMQEILDDVEQEKQSAIASEKKVSESESSWSDISKKTNEAMSNLSSKIQAGWDSLSSGEKTGVKAGAATALLPSFLLGAPETPKTRVAKEEKPTSQPSTHASNNSTGKLEMDESEDSVQSPNTSKPSTNTSSNAVPANTPASSPTSTSSTATPLAPSTGNAANSSAANRSSPSLSIPNAQPLKNSNAATSTTAPSTAPASMPTSLPNSNFTAGSGPESIKDILNQGQTRHFPAEGVSNLASYSGGHEGVGYGSSYSSASTPSKNTLPSDSQNSPGNSVSTYLSTANGEPTDTAAPGRASSLRQSKNNAPLYANNQTAAVGEVKFYEEPEGTIRYSGPQASGTDSSRSTYGKVGEVESGDWNTRAEVFGTAGADTSGPVSNSSQIQYEERPANERVLESSGSSRSSQSQAAGTATGAETDGPSLGEISRQIEWLSSGRGLADSFDKSGSGFNKPVGQVVSAEEATEAEDEALMDEGMVSLDLGYNAQDLLDSLRQESKSKKKKLTKPQVQEQFAYAGSAKKSDLSLFKDQQLKSTSSRPN